MCSRVKCPKCGKATWSGCGAHVEQALAGVPEEKRCHCAQQQQKKQQPSAEAGSWLSWIRPGR